MGGAGDVRLDAALVDAADAHDAESSALGDAFARALAQRSDDDAEVTAAPGDAADVLTVEEVAALLKVGATRSATPSLDEKFPTPGSASRSVSRAQRSCGGCPLCQGSCRMTLAA